MSLLANQGDSQPQEVIVASPAEPLRKTSGANLEVVSAPPFQTELMKVTHAGKSKEMDKGDIEMTTFSADTHSTNSS